MSFGPVPVWEGPSVGPADGGLRNGQNVWHLPLFVTELEVGIGQGLKATFGTPATTVHVVTQKRQATCQK